MDKPDILEIIGARVELRQAGREFRGLCPLHDDRRPSLRINAEKQSWYCDPCAIGGDVFKFLMLADGLTFPQALRALGIDGNDRPPAPRVSPNRKAAGLLADWANNQYRLIGARCRQITHQIVAAEQAGDAELIESLTHEWEILSDLHGDLAKPAYVAELWESRESIEQITDGVELEPPDPFPPLTDSYREYLRSLVRC